MAAGPLCVFAGPGGAFPLVQHEILKKNAEIPKKNWSDEVIFRAFLCLYSDGPLRLTWPPGLTTSRASSSKRTFSYKGRAWSCSSRAGRRLVIRRRWSCFFLQHPSSFCIFCYRLFFAKAKARRLGVSRGIHREAEIIPFEPDPAHIGVGKPSKGKALVAAGRRLTHQETALNDR